MWVQANTPPRGRGSSYSSNSESAAAAIHPSTPKTKVHCATGYSCGGTHVILGSFVKYALLELL